MKKATLVVAIALVSLFALGSAACGSQTDEAAIKAEAKAEAVAEAKKEVREAEKRQEAEARENAEEEAAEAKLDESLEALELLEEGKGLTAEVQTISTEAADRLMAGDLTGCDVLPELESKVDRLDAIIAEVKTLDIGDQNANLAAMDSSMVIMRDALGQAKGACASIGY